jgi:hypothetical protein
MISEEISIDGSINKNRITSKGNSSYGETHEKHKRVLRQLSTKGSINTNEGKPLRAIIHMGRLIKNAKNSKEIIHVRKHIYHQSVKYNVMSTI